MAGIVIVFDFDKTIIDCDSDNWVIDDLGATHLFDELLKTLPWNSAMDRIMSELHSQGKSMEEIADILKKAPLYPSTISAIKSAFSLGCELRILSDANLFFIETILKHHGLMGYFSEIHTNPSYVDAEGKLRIFPYHDFTTSSHGCSLCPPNMCKGEIIEGIKTSVLAEGKNRFIYLGDGKGDYCPSLRKSEVHEWSNAEELEETLLQLIKAISVDVDVDVDEANQFFSMDCKFQTIPFVTHKALPKALPIPQ